MKKLIHFNHYSDFSKKKVSASADNTTYRYGCEGDIYNGTPDIKYSQIVFVKDTHQICTHGELYDCNSSEGATKAPINLGGIVSGVQIQDTSANEIDYVVWDTQAKILLGCKKGMLLKYYSNWNDASKFGTRSGNDWTPFDDVFYIIGESLYIGSGGTLISLAPKPATTETDGLMSAIDKTKLDDIDKSVISKSASVARGTVRYIQIDTLNSLEHVGMWRVCRNANELSTNINYGFLVVADDWGHTRVSQLYFGSLNPTDWQTPEDGMPYLAMRRYKDGQWSQWERIEIDLSNATDINVASTHPEDISPDGAAIVVREANRMGAGSGTVYNSQAPRIGFNWKDRWWAQILMVSNVFKFVRGANDTKWADIQAGEIQGTEVKTSSGIKLSSVGSVANLETDDKSTLVAATNELAGRVKCYTVAQKALLQISVDYLLPSWQPEKLYPKGSIVRVGGRVFMAMGDTETFPCNVIGDGENIEVNTNWQVLIDYDVNEENWAQLDLDNLPTMSITEQMELFREQMTHFEEEHIIDYAELKRQTEFEIHTKTEEIVSRTSKSISDLVEQYDGRFDEVLKTIEKQETIIAEQKALIEKQEALLDEFTRSVFVLDSYTPKSTDTTE